MRENVNTTVKWLRYLLYVGIAAAVNFILGNFLLGSLSRWVGYALSALSVYLLLRLASTHARYKTAALFCAGSLICNLVGIRALALAASICGIVGLYQEYYGHSELIREREPKLAGQWSNLFWLQLAVELIGVLLVSQVVPAIGTVIVIATVAVSFVSIALKILYPVYLMRTIKALKSGFSE